MAVRERFPYKRIADPVHGTIGLTKSEIRILETPTFQRLRNVKQLGFAHYVFPGADYSRFSHSLGVCHIIGRVLQVLEDTGRIERDDRRLRTYRLAGLLHDVGHYPFSHATEHAVDDFYKQDLFATTSSKKKGSRAARVDAEPPSLMHEAIGKRLVTESEIAKIIEEDGVDPREVAKLIRRETVDPLASLVSSDLDADRVDYLMRTAHHTGLPYGNVDLDYLISQATVDGTGRFCLTSKALATADHFLLGRFFDYHQVTYHKTVVAFEWLLKAIVKELLSRNLLDYSGSAVAKLIRSGEWRLQDDALLLAKINELHNALSPKDELRAMTHALLARVPPKLIWRREFFSSDSDRSEREINGLKTMLENRAEKWAKESGIPRALWHVWPVPGWAITKLADRMPLSAAVAIDEEAEEKARAKLHAKHEESLHIQESPAFRAKPIVSMPASLMNILSIYGWFDIRLYVLLPSSARISYQAVRTMVRKELKELGQLLPERDEPLPARPAPIAIAAEPVGRARAQRKVVRKREKQEKKKARKT